MKKGVSLLVRGRKARKRKGEKVPFPPSLIPSPFSFVPVLFRCLSRRLEVVAWHERRAATFNAWSISNRQRYGNRPGKPSSTGTACDSRMNRARGGSRRLNRGGGRFNKPHTVNCAVFISNNNFTGNQLNVHELLYFKVMPSKNNHKH